MGEVTNEAGRDGGVRDDRIFPETRWISLIVLVALVIAGIILYFFPFNTKELFAWEIMPQMTALVMGAGYLYGSYFLIRVLVGGRWHWFTNGFLAITPFTWFMGAASLLHLDRFNGFPPAIWAWLGLYFLTPFVIPALWLRNRVTDPGTPEADDVIVPKVARLISVIGGGLLFAVALFMFFFPQGAIDIWPWQLTPFTARVVGGWVAVPGILFLVLALDTRWSAWRILVEGYAIGLVLMLIATVRAWGDFEQDKLAATLLFVGSLSLWLIFLVALYVSMEQRRRYHSSRRAVSE